MNIEKTVSERATYIEEYLKEKFPSVPYEQKSVSDAMKYSLLAKGKRLRPILFLEFYRICGGNNESAAMDFACALEMIHTYSLIHDDLPCMDDDDMRRGMPSCHVAFDYPTALLAGDALLNLAFETMLSADCDPGLKVKAASFIAEMSGIFGMIGGQTIDVCENGILKDISELKNMVLLKTGALLKAACSGGCILAGAGDDTVAAAKSFAAYLGEAFQIRDDVLDVIGDESKLGKKTGSDSKQYKTTYMTELGLEKCRKETRILTDKALSLLSDRFATSQFLPELTEWLTGREY
ncbi:MAG: polyprenyl synthetase family protein [Clostridia bacterium]|nr:polyprenyl synthetase family protein [Clostridia bacterium]